MQPTSTSTPAGAEAEADAAYYRTILHGLIDRGADLARQVHERAALESRPGADPTIAFDRIARAVRRTIALARHIAANPVATQKQTRAQTRQKLIRGVEDAIHRRRNETDAESLYAELTERLDDPELELDLQHRPIDEIIEEIARDLGVNVQARSYVHKRRTPQDISRLREQAASPSSLPGKGGAGGGSTLRTPSPLPGKGGAGGGSTLRADRFR